MIIYGIKTSKTATEILACQCANCETPNTIQMTLLQKYAHVFWIPLFPINKTAKTTCSHCKQVLEKKEFNKDLNHSFKVMKTKTKIPVWSFSGLILLTLFFIYGILNQDEYSKMREDLIAKPLIGDVYHIKIDKQQYTLGKVSHVQGDTVLVLFHQFETNKLSGLKNLKSKGDEAYNSEPTPLHKSVLKSMLDKGEIVRIIRD
jgi:hypothetical protein